MSKDADSKLHAWALLLSAHATLIDGIEAALAGAKLPSLAWYDVLWELEKAESGKLRMHELARRIVLSRSNLTRLADRLEHAGLIRRVDAARDPRGYDRGLPSAGLGMAAKQGPP